jgi:hypothetical protein
MSKLTYILSVNGSNKSDNCCLCGTEPTKNVFSAQGVDLNNETLLKSANCRNAVDNATSFYDITRLQFLLQNVRYLNIKKKHYVILEMLRSNIMKVIRFNASK